MDTGTDALFPGLLLAMPQWGSVATRLDIRTRAFMPADSTVLRLL
ncbi:hypothetical protein [Haloarcula mannanilytica]|nr:hypothetical protein [Haloarcula mannanilytica]